MNFKEYVFIALRDIRKRKGRTFLTAFGITIGTLLIVTMAGLSTGLKQFMINTVNDGDTARQVMIQPYKYFTDEDAMDMDMSNFEEDYFKKLDDNLIKELKDTGLVDSLVASIRFSLSNINIDGKDYSNHIMGTGYNIGADVFPQWHIDQTRNEKGNDSISPFNYGRDVKGDGEIVVGEDLLSSAGVNPENIIGKKLKINISSNGKVKLDTVVKEFTIVGVVNNNFEKGDRVSMSAKDAAEITGYMTFQKDYMKNRGYDGINIAVKSVSDVSTFTQKVRDLDYMYNSTEDMAKEIDSKLGGITTAFAVLGVVVLVVAAIGIVNTMSMSVLERTKSIGVMKSVGADRGAIKSIFLVQSSLIGFIGGLIGILLGKGINTLVELGINNFIKGKELTMTISVGLPVLWEITILVFAVGVALISGIYPASKAAKLDPIEALRK